MAAYAQLGDVETAIGKPIAPEDGHTVAALLDEAESELAAVVGDLASRVTAGSTTAELLRSAVVGMVIRVLRGVEERRALEAGTSTGEERAALRRELVVTRRERMLAGIPAAAWSVALSAADTTLACPQIPAPPRPHWWGGSRLWR
jgi:hypothetical protein